MSGQIEESASDSHQNSETKLLQASAVLWWGTTWEGDVLLTFDSGSNYFSDDARPRAVLRRTFCTPTSTAPGQWPRVRWTRVCPSTPPLSSSSVATDDRSEGRLLRCAECAPEPTGVPGTQQPPARTPRRACHPRALACCPYTRGVDEGPE